MAGRPGRQALALVGGVVTAVVVLGLLRFLLPGCSDVVNFDQSMLCLGGLGGPTWKPALVLLVVSLATGAAIRGRTG